ncbi:MAG: hypothetical protein ABI091_14800 [Ferruginibacter sp.]
MNKFRNNNYKMKAKGSDLIFISWILRNGSGTEKVSEDMTHLDDTVFKINSLSMTHSTFIAYEFNYYVVKFKDYEKFIESKQK